MNANTCRIIKKCLETDYINVHMYIYTNEVKRNVFACFRMAAHALYGIAPCCGHTGVSFDVENDWPDPAASEVILKPPEAFFVTKGFVLGL